MNRRSMLGSLAAVLLAPFVPRAKAHASGPISPSEAGLRDGEWIEATYFRKPCGDDPHLEAVIADCSKVNASAFEVAVAGNERCVEFPPETLMLARIARRATPGASAFEHSVGFVYKAAGWNTCMHPSGELRRIKPAPYESSHFGPFVGACGRGVVFDRPLKKI